MSIAKNTLSVVIPTFNCADNLRLCLNSVKWANEIIVVDMGSRDGTLGVAKVFGAKIIKRIQESGNFDLNRKLGMEIASGDWILKLDSDEVLSVDLQKEIQDILVVGTPEDINGYNLCNRVFMFGKEVRHGFVKAGSHELRLFRRNKWHYHPYRFHQQVTVTGKTGNLKGYYFHNNYRLVSEFISKMNKYTSFDANILARAHNVGIIQVFLAPIKSFIKLYLLQEGFLDQGLGIEVSFLYSIYNLVEKIKETEKN